MEQESLGADRHGSSGRVRQSRRHRSSRIFVAADIYLIWLEMSGHWPWWPKSCVEADDHGIRSTTGMPGMFCHRLETAVNAECADKTGALVEAVGVWSVLGSSWRLVPLFLSSVLLSSILGSQVYARSKHCPPVSRKLVEITFAMYE